MFVFSWLLAVTIKLPASYTLYSSCEISHYFFLLKIKIIAKQEREQTAKFGTCQLAVWLRKKAVSTRFA
jgi:hypothetical protein